LIVRSDPQHPPQQVGQNRIDRLGGRRGVATDKNGTADSIARGRCDVFVRDQEHFLADRRIGKTNSAGVSKVLIDDHQAASRRNDEIVDRRDVLLGIDEQPNVKTMTRVMTVQSRQLRPSGDGTTGSQIRQQSPGSALRPENAKIRDRLWQQCPQRSRHGGNALQCAPVP
jgi:hypothetical protein